MTLGELIKQYRKEHGINMRDFASTSGLSRAYISILERNYNPATGKPIAPSIDAIKKVSEAMGMEFDTVFNMIDGDVTIQSRQDASSEYFHPLLPENVRRASKKRYKYLGEIACGEPIFADEQYETYVDLEYDLNADFVLKAKGDSMINARIHDGDLVFIREQPDVNDGEIAAVIIDDEATLKRVYKYEDHIALYAENPAYKPIQVRANDGKNVRIIGKAVAATIYIK